MKRYSALILGSFVVLAGMATSASAQFGRQTNRNSNSNADRVCVYRDNNFNGNGQCFNPGDEVSDIKNSEISSIRIFGQADVVVFEDKNFRGDSREFTSDARDLAQVQMSGSKSWNDRVGSMRVISRSASGRNNGDYGRTPDRDRDYRNDGRGYPQNGQQTPRDGICVFENPNYQGRSECWSDGAEMPDLGGWSDRISSIRVTGNARAMVYRDVRFRGASQLIDRDVPNLARNWNDQISSLEVESANGRGNGRGWARGRRY